MFKNQGGRPPCSVRPFVEGFPRLDVWWLTRRGPSGAVTWTHTGGGTDELVYRADDRGYRITRNGRSQRIETTALPQPLGGHRLLFRCPDCSQRCRFLLLARRLTCRCCAGALYRSQFEGPVMTAARLRRRLWDQLQERDGIQRSVGPWPRPKQMWRRTWAQIEARDEALAARWRNGIKRKFGVCSDGAPYAKSSSNPGE